MSSSLSLEEQAIAAVSEQRENGKSFKVIGEEIGYSRSAVSLFHKKKYPNLSTDKISQAILNAYGSGHVCPFLSQLISEEKCLSFSTKSMPTNSTHDLKHWQACQTCSQKKGVAHD